MVNTKGVEDGISDEQKITLDELAICVDHDPACSCTICVRIRRAELAIRAKRRGTELADAYTSIFQLAAPEVQPSAPPLPEGKELIDWSPLTEREIRRGQELAKELGLESQPVESPEPPTFANYLSAYLTRNGGDEGHMRADISLFMHVNGWQAVRKGRL
jgi:hypothetical protein